MTWNPGANLGFAEKWKYFFLLHPVAPTKWWDILLFTNRYTDVPLPSLNRESVN